MKLSKRGQRAIDTLRTIRGYLDYYTNGSDCLKDEFKELESLIEELGIERKEDHIRFAKKLKALWKQNEKEEENV